MNFKAHSFCHPDPKIISNKTVKKVEVGLGGGLVVTTLDMQVFGLEFRSPGTYVKAEQGR